MKKTRVETAREFLARHPELMTPETEKALWELFKKASAIKGRQGKWAVLKEIANFLEIPNEQRQDSSDLWGLCSAILELVRNKNRLNKSGIVAGDKVLLSGEGPFAVKSITVSYLLIIEKNKGAFDPTGVGLTKVA